MAKIGETSVRTPHGEVVVWAQDREQIEVSFGLKGGFGAPFAIRGVQLYGWATYFRQANGKWAARTPGKAADDYATVNTGEGDPSTGAAQRKWLAVVTPLINVWADENRHALWQAQRAELQRKRTVLDDEIEALQKQIEQKRAARAALKVPT